MEEVNGIHDPWHMGNMGCGLRCVMSKESVKTNKSIVLMIMSSSSPHGVEL